MDRRRQGLVTTAAFVALVLAAPIAAGKSNHPGRAPHAPPPVVRAACPEALSDGVLVDARVGDQLAALAAAIKWDGGSAGGPTQCHREVRLHCGPDLDRDGDQEAIVEIASRSLEDGQRCDEPLSSGEPAPAMMRHLFLVSRHAASWRTVARLVATGDEGGDEARRSGAYFVKQPGGKVGVRVDSYVAHGACEVGGYEVFSLRGGALVSVARGDLSAPCAPCGCQP